MSFKEALFGFLSEPVQDVGSNHKVAAVSLKIQCWLTFIFMVIAVPFGLFLSFAALVGGALVGSFIESFGWWDSGDEAGALAGAFLFMVFLFATFVIFAFMALWLWWANTVYLKWNRTEDGALTWVNVFGGVLTFFSLGSFADLAATGVVGGNFLSLVLGVLILIFANLANSQGELGGGQTQVDGGAGSI